MRHAASAITAPDADHLPVYWQFHEAVARAQLSEWLPSGRQLLVDVSGPRAPAAELAARAGHTVLRVIDADLGRPAGYGGTGSPPLRGPGGYGGAGSPPVRGVSGGSPPGKLHCVYKPIAGERPLWDFPTGTLAGREVAAYVVSRAAGWDVVPPTVMRDGPFGPGMCQLWIDHDTNVDLIALSRRTDHAGLRDMAVFDAVVNNADRKIGHLLPIADGHLFGCDHGVCFAEDYKLRTVLWQWRGKTLPRRSLEALRRLSAQLSEGGLEAELSSLLTAAEIAATRLRVETLLKHRVHPYPPADWPAVPWPPV